MSEEFAELLQLTVELVDSQAVQAIQPGDGWLNDAQTLSMKLFQHASSVQVLAQGTSVAWQGTRPFSFVDHASINLITRAALETYLVFFYVYGGQDRARSKFRHATWQLGGLADRQEYNVSSAEHRQKLDLEARQIDELRTAVQAAPEFQSIGEKQQRRLLVGDWRVGRSWADLATEAGFHERYFAMIYSHLCGYSHASYLSALQVRDAWQSHADQQQLAQTAVGVGTFILAHFVFAYSALFSSAQATLDLRPKGKAIATKWRFSREDLARHYGS